MVKIFITYVKKVQAKFKENVPWNTAMDEVRTERLLEEHEESTLKILIRDWPKSKGYVGKPELISSLEHQVILKHLIQTKCCPKSHCAFQCIER